MVGQQRRRAARWVAVGLYVALVAFALLSPLAPRVFWTMAMPVLPLGIVLFGVYRWRSACPVAAIGQAGAKLAPTRAHKRIPRWLREHGMTVSMGVLVLCLTLRHVATNGDHLALGLFLIALPMLAIAVNARFGGRAFCQYICPVGAVERIYTDGAPPVATAEAEPQRLERLQQTLERAAGSARPARDHADAAALGAQALQQQAGLAILTPVQYPRRQQATGVSGRHNQACAG